MAYFFLTVTKAITKLTDLTLEIPVFELQVGITSQVVALPSVLMSLKMTLPISSHSLAVRLKKECAYFLPLNGSQSRRKTTFNIKLQRIQMGITSKRLSRTHRISRIIKKRNLQKVMIDYAMNHPSKKKKMYEVAFGRCRVIRNPPS